MSKTTNKFSPEVRDRAVRLVRRATSFTVAPGSSVSATTRAFTSSVVSRMWWKLPSSGLRACNDGSSQAARSRDIGASG